MVVLGFLQVGIKPNDLLAFWGMGYGESVHALAGTLVLLTVHIGVRVIAILLIQLLALLGGETTPVGAIHNKTTI